MKIKTEYVWFGAPIAALLRQVGGTFFKLVDRVGFPGLLLASAWTFLGWSWLWVPMAVCVWLTRLLPVTLFGDSVLANPANILYVLVLGILQAAPSVFIGIKTRQIFLSVTLSFLVGFVYFTFVFFSNVFLQYYFQWKWVEFVCGAIVYYPYAQLIQLGREEI